MARARLRQGQMTSLAAPPALSQDEARRLTDEVREDVRTLWAKVLDLYERGAHLALDYPNWGAYWEAEFGQSGGRGEQLVRAGRVARALGEAELPLPTNDLVARQLTPVLRRDPDKLAEVWTQAIEASDGKPTARQVAALVEPYRVKREASKTRGKTRTTRNHVSLPLVSAHGLTLSARQALDKALTTNPDADMIGGWIDRIDDMTRALGEMREALSRRLGQ
jgi:hypothetical protein